MQLKFEHLKAAGLFFDFIKLVEDQSTVSLCLEAPINQGLGQTDDF